MGPGGPAELRNELLRRSTTFDQLTPFLVALPGRVADVDAGGRHCVVALATGEVCSWGVWWCGGLGLRAAW